MSKKNDNTVHGEPDNNIIKFPEPPASSSFGGEEDVGDESPTGFYFIPDWDTDDNDPAA
jgi:hypothetical protein